MIDQSNDTSFKPKYYRIYEDLHQKLLAGDFEQGERFPSENELVERYQVSRGTVLQAIKMLIGEGYLRREQGKGTFVNFKKISQDPERLMGFTELMQKHDMEPSGRILTRKTLAPGQAVQKIMELKSNERVVHLVRLRLGDLQPLIIEQSYFNYTYFEPLLNEDLENQSIFRLLHEKTDYRLGSAQQTIEAKNAGPFEHQQLTVSIGTPLLVIKRLVRLTNGSCFQYSEDIYRSDQISFSTTTHPFEDDHNADGLPAV